MATLITYTALDMGDYSDTGGDNARIISTTSTKVVLAEGKDRYVYLGHFEYNSAHKMTAGTFTGFETYTASVLQWKMSQVSIPVQTFINYLDANDPQGFDQYIMRGTDAIQGSAFADRLYGWAGNDKITGNGGSDVLLGGNGNDALYGGAGSDILSGQVGNDLLIGGDGADYFVFNTALSSNSNVDRIEHYSTSADTIKLDNIVFKKLVATGHLNSSYFKASTSGNATDSNDYILYETDTGAISYDADGNGAGAKVKFALIGAHLDLTAADFVVV